ncbi:MAG: CBS domain-containing protein [Sulfolobales archaeon]
MYVVPKVSSYMSFPVIKATAEDSILTVRDLMFKHRVGSVVIMEDKRVVGIVCKGDFIKIAYNRKRYLKPLDTVKVDEIMTTPVYATSPNKTIKSVANFMSKQGLSHLPVIDSNEELVGIITKHDVLRAFSQKFYGMFKVSDFMLDNPITVSPTHSIFYVVDALLKSSTGKVVVVGEGKPIGIITKSDVLQPILNINAYLRSFSSSSKSIKSLYEVFKSSTILIASDVMTADPIIVSHNEDLAKAADIMVKNRIGCLPVVNSKGTLVGLIVKDSIIKALKSMKTKSS